MLDAMLMLVLYNVYPDRTIIIHSNPHMVVLYLEAVALHAELVFRNEVGAFFLRIARVREEHAFVALGLFVGADAAGLSRCSATVTVKSKYELIPWASRVCSES